MSLILGTRRPTNQTGICHRVLGVDYQLDEQDEQNSIIIPGGGPCCLDTQLYHNRANIVIKLPKLERIIVLQVVVSHLELPSLREVKEGEIRGKLAVARNTVEFRRCR